MADESRDQTERVVLKLIPMSEVEIDDSLGSTTGTSATADVWRPVLNPNGEFRVFKGTKKQCIEAYAGKNGKDKPGTYRAPSLRAWKGEHEFEPDPEPRMKHTERP